MNYIAPRHKVKNISFKGIMLATFGVAKSIFLDPTLGFQVAGTTRKYVMIKPWVDRMKVGIHGGNIKDPSGFNFKKRTIVQAKRIFSLTFLRKWSFSALPVVQNSTLYRMRQENCTERYAKDKMYILYYNFGLIWGHLSSRPSTYLKAKCFFDIPGSSTLTANWVVMANYSPWKFVVVWNSYNAGMIDWARKGCSIWWLKHWGEDNADRLSTMQVSTVTRRWWYATWPPGWDRLTEGSASPSIRDTVAEEVVVICGDYHFGYSTEACGERQGLAWRICECVFEFLSYAMAEIIFNRSSNVSLEIKKWRANRACVYCMCVSFVKTFFDLNLAQTLSVHLWVDANTTLVRQFLSTE